MLDRCQGSWGEKLLLPGHNVRSADEKTILHSPNPVTGSTRKPCGSNTNTSAAALSPVGQRGETSTGANALADGR